MLANFKRLNLSSKNRIENWIVFLCSRPFQIVKCGSFKKIFLSPFGPQFGLKIRRLPDPPGPLPWIPHCKIDKPIAFCRSHSRHRSRYYSSLLTRGKGRRPYFRPCMEVPLLYNLTHRRTDRGGEGGCSPPKFWATQIFWAARENLGKASF